MSTFRRPTDKGFTLGPIDMLLSFQLAQAVLKSYCTVFQHALKSLEITGIILTLRMSKTVRKNSKRLKSYKGFKF